MGDNEEPLDRYCEKLLKDSLKKQEADAAIARLKRELAPERVSSTTRYPRAGYGKCTTATGC